MRIAAAELHANVLHFLAEGENRLVLDDAFIVPYYVLFEPLLNLISVSTQLVVFFVKGVKLEFWAEPLAYLLVYLAV